MARHRRLRPQPWHCFLYQNCSLVQGKLDAEVGGSVLHVVLHPRCRGLWPRRNTAQRCLHSLALLPDLQCASSPSGHNREGNLEFAGQHSGTRLAPQHSSRTHRGRPTFFAVQREGSDPSKGRSRAALEAELATRVSHESNRLRQPRPISTKLQHCGSWRQRPATASRSSPI